MQLYAYFRFLPYTNQRLNKIQLAFACVVVSAAAATLLGIGLKDSTYSTAAIAWLLVMPTTAYAGWASADLRFRQFSSSMELASVYDVELRARYLASALIDDVGASADGLNRGFRGQADYRSSSQSSYSKKHVKEVYGGALSTNRSSAAANNNSSGDKSNRGDASHRSAASATSRITSAAAAAAAAISAGSDAEAANGDVFSSGVRAIEELYTEALEVFNGHPLIELFYSQFNGAIKHNRHLDRVHMRLAESNADALALDIHFFAFQRAKETEISEGSKGDRSAGSSKMTVEKRMRFEMLLSKAREQVGKCRGLVASFWACLGDKMPDLARLSDLGVQINGMLHETDATFKELLALAPQSAAVMRQYADFLLELANDPRKAVELLTDAEQIEDDQSKAHASSDLEILLGAPVPDFDLSSESAALMRVSARLDSMGTVIAANASTLKLFGYSNRDFIGRNMNVVVPEPIAGVHDSFLQHYLDIGEERMINTSRIYFGLHRHGYIFPLKQNVRPTAGDDWACVGEEIVTPYSFIWFMGHEVGWKVTAVCRSSMATLGIDIPSMKAGAVSMNHFLSDIPGHVAQLQDEDGSLITLRNTAAESAAGNTLAVYANLQVCAVPFLPSKLFILRWRRATDVDKKREKLHLRKANGASGVHFPGGSADGSDDVDATYADGDVLSVGSGGGGGSSVAGSDDINGSDVGDHSAGSRRDNDDDYVNDSGSDLLQHDRRASDRFVPRHHNVAAVPSALKGAKRASIGATPTAGTAKTNTHLRTAPAGHAPFPADADISMCPVMGGGSRMKRNALNGSDGSSGSGSGSGRSDDSGGKEATGSRGSTPTAAALRRVAFSAAEAAEEGAQPDAAAAASGDSAAEPVVLAASNSAGLMEQHDPKTLVASMAELSHSATDQQHHDSALANTTTPSIATTRRRGGASGKGSTTSKTGSASQRDNDDEDDNGRNSRRTTSSAGNHMDDGGTGKHSKSKQKRTPTDGSVHSVNHHAPAAEKASSVHSGHSGSKHSGTSATSVTEVLRRGVTARGKHLESSLRQLRRSVWAIFLCIATMNIVSLVLTNTLFDQLLANITLVVKNGERGVRLQRIYSIVQGSYTAACVSAWLVVATVLPRAGLRVHSRIIIIIRLDWRASTVGASITRHTL